MKTVHIFIDGDYPVELRQAASGRFTVAYGKQIARNLSYAEAASEYGQCVMHSLRCAGLLDAGV